MNAQPVTQPQLQQLDANRAALETSNMQERMQHKDCPNGRYVRIISMQDQAGKVRRVVLREAVYGQPQASSVWAYYDARGQLFYVTLYRYDKVDSRKVRAYISAGVPFYTVGLTRTGTPSAKLLKSLSEPAALVKIGPECAQTGRW